MTKQEEIREGIQGRLTEWRSKYHVEWIGSCYAPIYDVSDEELTNQILAYLHSQGVVIKVDRELPPMFGTVDSYLRGFQKMREDGFVAAEPLIIR